MTQTTEGSGDVLDSIKQQLAATEGGPSVRESVRRHYENLEHLAAGLRRLGMDEQDVGENVTAVFREYGRELANYMASISRAELAEAAPPSNGDAHV